MSKPTTRELTTTKNKPEKKRRKTAKTVRKEQSAADLRAKMKASYYLRQLDTCAKGFVDLAKIAKEGAIKGAVLNVDEVRVHDLHLKALNSLAALNLRRLNKVIPDLQAIALVTDAPTSPLADLAAAVAANPITEHAIDGQVIDVEHEKKD